MENLERRRRARTESEHQVERLEGERGRLEQEQRSDVEQERQRLVEDLERVKTRRQAERQEEERVHLERELQRSQSELEPRKRAAARDRGDKSVASRSWRRRPLLVAGLLLGALTAWFTSLVVALNVLDS